MGTPSLALSGTYRGAGFSRGTRISGKTDGALKQSERSVSHPPRARWTHRAVSTQPAHASHQPGTSGLPRAEGAPQSIIPCVAGQAGLPLAFQRPQRAASCPHVCSWGRG